MKEEINAVVDIREPPKVLEAVKDHEQIDNVTLDKLDAGDIVIMGVGFERKTPQDYASSLVGKSDRTLSDQIEKLKQGFNNSYILVEGDYRDMGNLPYTNINPKSLYGSTASCEARHDISVDFCSNLELLVDRAVRLSRKHNEDPVSQNIMSGSVVGIEEPFAKRVYSCIDGVGKSLAESLYESYPRVDQLLDADKGDLREIEGIGEKLEKTILESFRSKE